MKVFANLLRFRATRSYLIQRSPLFLYPIKPFSTFEYDQKIAQLKSRSEIESFLQDEGNRLNKENLCHVLEQIAITYQTDESIDKNNDLLKEQCLKSIFKVPLSEYEPLYIASILDSMVKLHADKSNWRLMEKLLSRNQFFSRIDDIGIIAMILDRYNQTPHSTRELDLEEVFDKAEIQVIKLMDTMIEQKKLAEDVNFDATELALLLESFVLSISGSEQFFDKAQKLTIKFKYAVSDQNLISIVNSLLLAKIHVLPDLMNPIKLIKKDQLTFKQCYQLDDIQLQLKMDIKTQQGPTYVVDRNQLKITNPPHVAQKHSYKVLLKEGSTYYYCTCGLSKSQPFCDGSHQGASDYLPLKFTYQEDDRIIGLCGCKMNNRNKGPFCDGSHKKINFDKLMK